MQLPTRILGGVATLPAVLASTGITVVLAAGLPSAAQWALLIAGPAISVILAAGRLERRAVRLLHDARRLSPAQCVALRPVATLLCGRGLGPPTIDLYVASRPRDGPATAFAVGRRSVVLSPALARQVQTNRLPADQAAAVIAGAVADLRLGHSRYDVAVAFWTLPWRITRVGLAPVLRAVTALPLVASAWRLRFVVAGIAVAQSVGDGHVAAAGVLAAVLALSYVAPSAARARDERRAHAADESLATHDFADPLVRFLSVNRPVDDALLERLHRLRQPRDVALNTDRGLASVRLLPVR